MYLSGSSDPFDSPLQSLKLCCCQASWAICAFQCFSGRGQVKHKDICRPRLTWVTASTGFTFVRQNPYSLQQGTSGGQTSQSTCQKWKSNIWNPCLREKKCPEISAFDQAHKRLWNAAKSKLTARIPDPYCLQIFGLQSKNTKERFKGTCPSLCPSHFLTLSFKACIHIAA